MVEMVRVCAYDADGRWRWLKAGADCRASGEFTADIEAATLAALDARAAYPRVLLVDGDDAIGLELVNGSCCWPEELAALGCCELEELAAHLRERIALRTVGAASRGGSLP